ncbi:hypothetical protein AB0I72_04095 [Nocardiopsis sp. NPDC049922]|uniref:hypothetical protein n=1 Tax=Nocardiopsis sp. NPDC049922 TaxID=3155157 RepID=UPI00340F6714
MAKYPRDHLRWNLLDQPGDPVPWTSYDARSLKRFYERLADAADQAATDLRRLKGDELGEGETIKALKELVEELPSHLDKAHTAYEKGYKALEVWAEALDTARSNSETVARLAAGAYDGLAADERDTWADGEGGDDPLREEYVQRLRRVTDDLDEAAETAKNALEDAKQGDPNKLWGWLDAIVTWVEENPLIYAAIMVVAGIAAIFIPGLGIALAIAALSISAATLHREGKLGFNMETVLTLGLDAMSLIPGGVLLRGGRAVSRLPVASRVAGPLRQGVRNTTTAVRNSRAVQTMSTPIRAAQRTRAGRVGVDFVATGTKDTAVGMGSSIAVQMAGGTSWEDISLKNELVGAAATNFPAAGFSAGKAEFDLSRSGGTGAPAVTGTSTSGGDGIPDVDVDTTSGRGAGSGGGDGSTDGGGGNDAGPPRSEGGPGPSNAGDPAAPGSGDGSTPPADTGGTAPARTDGDPQATQAPAAAPAQSGGDTGPTHTGGDTGSVPSGGDTSSSQSGGDGSSSRTDGDPGSGFGDTARPRMPDAPDPDRYDDLGEGGVAVTRNAPAGSGGGDLPTRSQNRIEDPDLDSSGRRAADASEDTASPTPRTSGDARNHADDPAPAPDGSGTPAPGAPTTDAPTAATPTPAGDRIDVHGARGEYRTAEGPDGQPNVTYRYPAGDGDYTMNVSPDDVTVNGTSVRRTDGGFQVTNADGASVDVSSGDRGRPGTVELTGPNGERGPSYRDGQVSVPTRDGDVTVSRDGDGTAIRTDDGLTVSQSRDGAARIAHQGDDPVDLRFDDGPRVSRPGGEPGATPRTTVTDPRSGRTTEVGADGYRVDTGDGATHGYDRGTGTATLDSGGTRVEAGQHTVRVTDESRGVDMWRSRDGLGTATGAGSGARVREDGSGDILTDNPTSVPRATQTADGHVQIGDTRTWPGQVVNPDGSGVWIRPGGVDPVTGTRAPDTIEVRGADGSARSYTMDGRSLGEYPSLRPNPRTDGPSAHGAEEPDSFTMHMGGNLITVTSNADPMVSVDTPQGWSVSTSRDGGVSVSAPPDARGDRLQVTRNPDGSSEMSTDLHRIGSGPDGVTAHAPGGVHAGSTERGSHVGDGSLRTEVRSDGFGSAETRTTSGGPVAGHTGAEGHVSTDSGVTVRTSGNEVTADVPSGSNQTVRNDGRTIDVGPGGTSVRGPSPDTPETVPLRMGETAGDAGRVPPGWRVTATPEGGMAGTSRTGSNEISVRSPDEVEFRTGDVNGTQTRSGRSEVSDGNGTTVSDGRRGVRVNGGDGRPDLRITEDQVRVTSPDGDRQTVDIPTARPESDSGTRPDTDGDAPRSGADDASSGDRRSDGDPGSGDTSVRPQRDSLRDSITHMLDTLVKNSLNVTGGLVAEAFWMEGSAEGLQTADFVQAVAQMGTAVPKGLSEGRLGDTSDLPSSSVAFTNEMAHQAARNMWRDDYVGEYHGDQTDTAEERDAVSDDLSRVENELDYLEGELVPEIERTIERVRETGENPEALARLEALHSETLNQMKDLEQRKQSLQQEHDELHEEITHRTPEEAWDGLTDRS